MWCCELIGRPQKDKKMQTNEGKEILGLFLKQVFLLVLDYYYIIFSVTLYFKLREHHDECFNYFRMSN
jgi:hypothetical protein